MRKTIGLYFNFFLIAFGAENVQKERTTNLPTYMEEIEVKKNNEEPSILFRNQKPQEVRRKYLDDLHSIMAPTHGGFGGPYKEEERPISNLTSLSRDVYIPSFSTRQVGIGNSQLTDQHSFAYLQQSEESKKDEKQSILKSHL